MNWEVKPGKHSTILVGHGRGDQQAAGDFKAKTGEMISASNARLVLDLADVEYMASAFLGSLIMALKLARSAGGDIVLACPTENVRALFEMVNFDKSFAVYKSVEEADASLG